MGSFSQIGTERLLKEQAVLFNSICLLDDEAMNTNEMAAEVIEKIMDHWAYPSLLSVEIFIKDESFRSENFRESKNYLGQTGELKNGAEVELWMYKQKESDSFGEEEQESVSMVFHLCLQKLNHCVFATQIEEEKAKLDQAYKLADIGTWEYDMIEEELHWSDITKEVHGFGKDYEPDVGSTIQLFKEGYHRDLFEKAAMDAIEREKPFDVELKIISGQGDERWIRATGEPEYKNGRCVRFYGISQNVTERRKAKEDLEYNERRFKAMVQNGTDMMAILDEEANYHYVSPAAYNVLSIDPGYFIGRNAFDFIHPDDKSCIYKQFKGLAPGKSIQLSPFRFKDSAENWRWLEATITNLTDDPAVRGYISNARDITARQIKQGKILDSLKEKETLLAEIHHRIKNNLTGLIGMLQLQAYKENNEEVLERLFDSIARIHTMASIHEQLYQSNDYAQVDLSKRIKLLALNIGKTYKLRTDISHDFQLETVKLSLDQALPCSLITNEVLTNIHKHAFENRAEGTITLQLIQDEDENLVQLSIRDDGVGLPQDYKSGQGDSMGMTVIQMMAEKLNAEYSLHNKEQGTEFKMQFVAEE
ncbi:sensor histidine kinase [Gracilimonas mengyeensis]|uniref:PAS domain S-box-containing protein n=1 Tax=Gracilimonas mengyeensis TaxID=1302730 RepID=A0A521CFK1_9BACT|nr:histidine kinase dimerization/phosphoacceptor domain -containing protein [Gracilimonas mengyeensis]SMO58223.1 PAS domain S-box-containing protein [Gracilimonas mengyeensis]